MNFKAPCIRLGAFVFGSSSPIAPSWVCCWSRFKISHANGVERMEYLHRLLDRLDLLIAGLFGVIVASWWHKDDLTDWRAWMIFLITGVACALYLTGMVSSYLGVTEPNTVAGVGFLLGTFGGSLLAAINRAIKAADLWALIRQRFGGGNQQ